MEGGRTERVGVREGRTEGGTDGRSEGGKEVGREGERKEGREGGRRKIGVRELEGRKLGGGRK